MIDSFSRGIMLVDRRIKKIGGVVNFVIDRNDSNVWAGMGDSKLLNTCSSASICPNFYPDKPVL